MKNSYLQLARDLLFLTLLFMFIGCGSEGLTRYITPLPHKIDRAEFAVDEQIEQWYKYVSISSSYDRSDENNHKLIFDILFEKGISPNAKHFQVYIDTDYNATTGWSYGQGDAATIGADYMIEDSNLFRSTSNTEWTWEYVAKFDYQTIQEKNDIFKIKLVGKSSQVMSITNIKQIKRMNISIEPVDGNWQDTNNFITSQDIKMNILYGQNDTLYEDGEDGLSPNWKTILGKYTPERKTPGYKNHSKGFVKLHTDWVNTQGEFWSNGSEYHLPMNNEKQKVLSVDIVGDGLEMEHYILGAIVTTQKGERRLQWDSFYNHENKKAEKIIYENGNIFMVFPSPVELVRGHELSDPNLNENFKVNLELALKQFEPDNTILSVDTFVATGGNLDNIKLLSN
jgi:hypothetical protein